MTYNITFWEYHVREVFFRELDVLKECFLNKTLPPFDEEKLTEEAKRISDKQYEEVMNEPGTENDIDPGDIVLDAMDSGASYLYEMMDMRKTMIGIFCVALYHLFEQQLLFFGQREGNLNTSQVGDVRKWLHTKILLKTMNSYNNTEVLKHSCNAFKHGEGDSAKKLRKLRPDYFCWNLRLSTPIAGGELNIPVDDFIQFVQDIKDFWRELFSHLAKVDCPK